MLRNPFEGALNGFVSVAKKQKAGREKVQSMLRDGKGLRSISNEDLAELVDEIYYLPGFFARSISNEIQMRLEHGYGPR